MKTLIYTLTLALLLFAGCAKDENDFVQTSDFEIENGHITVTLNGKSKDGYTFNNETIVLSKYIDLDHSLVERNYFYDVDQYHIQRYGSVLDPNRRAYLGVMHQKIGEYYDEETKYAELYLTEIRQISDNLILNLEVSGHMYANSSININENTNTISGSFEFVQYWDDSENTLNVQVSFSAKVYESNH
jgi:hypothetical protein